MHTKNQTLAIVLIVTLAAATFASVAFYLFPAQAQTASPTTSPATPSTAPTMPSTSPSNSTSASSSSILNVTYISQALGTSLVVVNNQTGIITAVFLRQSPQIKEANGMIDNNITLMNSIVEFWASPSSNQTGNQTVFVTGVFGLLENETNKALQQAISYNWTILALTPYNIQESPKLQFLHWATWTTASNLTTLTANIKAVIGNTTIGTTSVMPSQPVNGSAIAASLNGTLINATGLIVIPRMDGNITSALFPGITLNGFMTMSSVFAFASMTNSSMTNSTGTGNASSTVVVWGQLALKESELSGVEKALLGNLTAYPMVTNVTITSIHSNFLSETPKMVFVNFVVVGDQNQTVSLLKQTISQTSMLGNASATK